MADVLTPEQRRLNMSRIRGKNTKPELLLRQGLHARGLRFRLHRKDLPGRPDLVFPRYSAAILVHGCFWHRHPGCRKASAPASLFWAKKFALNVARDVRVASELRKLGWHVVTIWECETRDPAKLSRIVVRRVLTRLQTRKTRKKP